MDLEEEEVGDANFVWDGVVGNCFVVDHLLFWRDHVRMKPIKIEEVGNIRTALVTLES